MLYLEVSSSTSDNEVKSSMGYEVTTTTWMFGDAYAVRPNPEMDFRSIAEDFGLQSGDTVHFVVAIWSNDDSMGMDEDSSCDIISAHSERYNAELSASLLTHSRAPINLPDDYMINFLPWTDWNTDFSRIEIVSKTIK